jgi:RNA polymerase sigma factor (sigma-70 family)
MCEAKRSDRQVNRNYAKREGSPDATHFCADDETLVRVLEAARTSAGAIAHRVVRNWHTAEDVVQEALLRAVVAQDHLQKIDNLEAWFRGVVRNIAVDRVRREVREREIMEALSAAGAFDDLVPHQQTETLEQEELRDLIREAMSQLNAHNRRVIDLFYLKNQTLKQVADCLGVSPNTVKQRLFRARDMLKSVLVTLSLDAYSVQTQKTRKAIIMKTTEKTVRPEHTIPSGWHFFGHTELFDIRVDPKCRLTGTGSATIAATSEAADVTAGLMQRFPAAQWRGRRLQARLWVSGQGLGERGFHAYLMAQDTLEVGCQVYWPRCGGTFNWQPIEAVLDVPETENCALMIAFAVIGPGQVWVDRIELEEAGNKDVPSRALSPQTFHSVTWPTFTNLDFSDTNATLAAAPRLQALAPGWYIWNSMPVAQVVRLDREVLMSGAASACIDHRGNPSRGLDMLYQRVPVSSSWRGRHLRMRGWTKTVDADRAGLWLRTDAAGGVCTAMDDMKARPIEGSSDWTSHELVAAITPDVTHVAFGGLLHGKGAIWIDRLEFDVVDAHVPCTTETWNGDGQGMNPFPQTLGAKSQAWTPQFKPHAREVSRAPRNLDFSEVTK